LRSEGHAAKDVQKKPGRKKLLYPEGHVEKICGLEDEARQVKKSRGQ
jgi:hypothetical protein